MYGPFGLLNQPVSPWFDPQKMDPNRVPLGLLSQQPDAPAPMAVEAGPMPQQPQQPMQLPSANGGAPAQPAQPQGGLLSGIDGFLNKLGNVYGNGGPGDSLINLGLAVASPGNMSQNIMNANAANNRTRLVNAQLGNQQQKAQGQNETARLLSQRLGITPEQALGLIQSGGAGQLITQAFTSPEQFKTETDAKGNLWQVNTKTGQRSLLQEGGVSTITDPAQRTALGVPADYKGPVQTDASGKLLMPGKAGVEVNMQGKFGTVPPGYQVKGDEASGFRMEPVPGSPAEREMRENERKDRDAQALKTVRSDVVLQDVDKILQIGRKANLPTTGWTGSFLSQFKGTDQFDVAAMLNSLKSITRIDTLQAMRAASPTGGALGNVSNQEGQMLESALGSLEQAQSRDQFERNLVRFRDLYMRTVHGPEMAQRLLQDSGDKSGVRNDLKSKYGLE